MEHHKVYIFSLKYTFVASLKYTFVASSTHVFPLLNLLDGFEWKDDREILEKYKSDIRNNWLKLLNPVFKI